MFGAAYYRLREVVPIILFVSYKTNKKFYPMNKYFILFVIPYMLFTLYCIIIYFMGYTMKEVFGFWTLEAPIEWGITLMFLLIIINYKVKNIPYSVTLSYLMVNAGGYIYEIPHFIKKWGLISVIRYRSYYPLFISSQIVSIVVVYLLLREKGIKINSLTVCSFIGYVVYCIVYLYTDYLWRLSYFVGKWFYRIPCILFLLSLAMGLIKVKDSEKK